MSRHIGSSLDLYLEEEGLLQEATAMAFQRVLAFRLRHLMRERHHALRQFSEWLGMEMPLLEQCLNPESSALDGEVLGDIARRLASRSKAGADETLVALSDLLHRSPATGTAAQGSRGSSQEWELLSGSGTSGFG